MGKKFKFKSRIPKKRMQFFLDTDEILNTDTVKGPHIEVFSNKKICVEGCLGIYDYRNDYMRLNIGKGSIVLCGCEFDIILYEENQITIKGNISTIEFCV